MWSKFYKHERLHSIRHDAGKVEGHCSEALETRFTSR